jgi:hypothetical protein
MKKGLLKNPLIVAGLIIIAIGFIFVNNILPYIKSNEVPAEDVPVEPISQQVQIDTPVVSELLPTDGIQQTKSLTLLKENMLKTKGWIRTTSRDPFENTRTDTEDEKTSKVADNNKTENVNVRIPITTVAKKPPVKVKSILKAISVGTIEKVALIGSSVYHEGDTCSLGVVKKIDPDSVIIAGPNGIRILHL